MNDEQKAAFVMAQAACAQADIAGMIAENTERVANGYTIAYDHAAFLAIQDRYLIGHNAVIEFMR